MTLGLNDENVTLLLARAKLLIYLPNPGPVDRLGQIENAFVPL